MNWELFYLICFVVGFAFTAISFLSGTLHFHFHLPGHVHVPTLGHAGGVHGAGHAAGQGHGSGHGPGHVSGAHFPFFNPMTLAAFLTWFGGAGYLLEHFKHMWIFAGFVLASAAGLTGASIVFVFVAKVLMAHERDLNPVDYEMVGVLGKVSVSIRTGGTGEIIFAQEGVRKTCAARSEDGTPFAKGEEVLVTRYERGVAYVQRWDDLESSAASWPEKKSTNQ
jgi:membrane protein implicated in regulation of membrane protease activity